MMHIGLSLTARTVGALAAQTQKAEDATLDFVLLDDAQSRRPQQELPKRTVPFEPTTLVSGLSTLSRKIGFVATAATDQHELYNLARRYASLDLISGGRVGWNVVASGPSAASDEEYIDVVSALWRSWDDEAFVYDKAAGRFFLPHKMHVIDHRGAYFTVRGPLNVNPSPQGRPVIAQAATFHTAGMAARSAEVMIIAGGSEVEDDALLAEIQRELVVLGRRRAEVRVLATIVPWVATARSQAQGCFEESSGSMAEESPEGLGRHVIGTAIDVADALQETFERSGIDGFTILPPTIPRGLDAFLESVIPELRRRRVFRDRYAGITLRDHLA
jgi:alkanesulfonate monooxygenase SsuD/methylene tetrahydromethanopterin reductase-like flavin-dependent oxidoreductase (luciferase family)